jgi:hypothetical protein
MIATVVVCLPHTADQDSVWRSRQVLGRRPDARNGSRADDLCHQISAPPPNEKNDKNISLMPTGVIQAVL